MSKLNETESEGDTTDDSKKKSEREKRSDGKCVLPQYPSHGNWEISTEKALVPGDAVTSGILVVTCDQGYKVVGNSYSFCRNGQWQLELGYCSELCPLLNSNDAIKVTCTVSLPFGGIKVVNCSEATNGTIARFECETFYENVKLNQNAYSICNNGKWNPDKPNCDPVCGRRVVHTKELIAGGETSYKGKYPWQIAIYKKGLTFDSNVETFVPYNKFICGGSLLNQKVILTAAHCVTNVYGDRLNKDLFTIAAGKFFRKFSDSRDADAQFSLVKDIFVPEEYKGDYQNYRADIAIVVTVKTFVLTKWIQPVCVDWARDYDQEFLHSNNTGYIAGWGHKFNDSNLSDTLQELEVPYIPNDICHDALPTDFTVYLTGDKLCSGYINKSASVCEGDSGGGLVSKSRLNGRYYITGIVSNSPQGETSYCNAEHYTLYTKVSTYLSTFIIEIELVNRPPPGSCVLFDHPKGGKWKIQGVAQDKKNPGDFVVSMTTLLVECANKTHFLVGVGNVTCLDGAWSAKIGICTDNAEGNAGGSTTTTTTEKPAKGSSCVLPPYPVNGNWKLNSIPNKYSPNDRVEAFTILQVSCDADYKLVGEEFLLCSNGAWQSEIGECSERCPPVVTAKDVTVSSCTTSLKNGGFEVIDCNDAVNSTIVEFQCGGKLMSKVGFGICHDGRWNPPIARCDTDCGEATGQAVRLRNESRVIAATDHPWAVAVYNRKQPIDKELICGGTLINPKVIVSAAHCFVETVQTTPLPASVFEVGVAKGYRDFSDTRDANAQLSRLSHIFLPEGYRGQLRYYQDDIAVLVTEKPFTFTASVQPICVDWGNAYDQLFFKSGNIGRIPGWSVGAPHNPDGALTEVSVPFVPKDTCLNALEPAFKSFFTADKICAGNFNDSGAPECFAFSGSGLTYKNDQDRKTYLSAVLSVAPRPQGVCNFKRGALYTRVSDYLKWFIIQKELEYRPFSATHSNDKPFTNGCQLPEYPRHGRWVIMSGPTNAIPGMPVDQGTVFSVRCDDRYKLSGGSTFAICTDGGWTSKIGQCLPNMCLPLKNSQTMNVTCILNSEVVSCERPPLGTIAKYKCAPTYEDVDLKEGVDPKCERGSWTPQAPKCSLACGKKPTSLETVVVEGRNVTKFEYPWQVALYKDDKKNRKVLLCGGTLINLNTVLTSAPCVTDRDGRKNNASLYTVAAGTFFREFKDSRDKHAQFSTLKHLHVHPDYKGTDTYYVSSVAVLVTKETFTPTTHVMPVCVDYSSLFLTKLSGEGIVVGWGYTIGKDAPVSDVLKEIKMPFVPFNECLERVPEGFTNFLTSDTMCTGLSTTKDTATCPGDSGGGLYFKNKAKDRYYLTSITSIAPVTNFEVRCSNDHFTIYTKISPYQEFIRKSSG